VIVRRWCSVPEHVTAAAARTNPVAYLVAALVIGPPRCSWRAWPGGYQTFADKIVHTVVVPA
jgi:hypothetical protein